MKKLNQLKKAKSKSNPKKAKKYDKGKPRMALISPVALFNLAQVMTDGEFKYGSHNWRNGFNWSRIADAGLRHFIVWLAGMDKDPDSGRNNMHHVLACVHMLCEMIETHPELDDRYKLDPKLLEKLYPKTKKKGKKL